MDCELHPSTIRHFAPDAEERGTHTEDNDPLSSGVETVTDFEPARKQRYEYSVVVSTQRVSAVGVRVPLAP